MIIQSHMILVEPRIRKMNLLLQVLSFFFSCFDIKNIFFDESNNFNAFFKIIFMLLSNYICSHLDSQRFVFEQLLQLHHYTNIAPVNIEFALWIFDKCLSLQIILLID